MESMDLHVSDIEVIYVIVNEIKESAIIIETRRDFYFFSFGGMLQG